MQYSVQIDLKCNIEMYDFCNLQVTVIAEAKCTTLESDLYYMENFNWNSTIKDMDDVRLVC